ncbi:MAG: hypothetical protein JNL18_23340 [Planctomycetaceae bacterium]|nr:hypothetical protein [Planctomycetaceae bacterium]
MNSSTISLLFTACAFTSLLATGSPRAQGVDELGEGDVRSVASSASHADQEDPPFLLADELLATDPWLDPAVTPAQDLAGVGAGGRRAAPRRGGSSFALGPRSSISTTRSGGASALGLASIPFMIGDTNAGTCLAFNGIIEWEVSNPSLSCSRLNISENNTAIPVDRAYFSYRHYENAAQLRLFQFADSFDVDQFTAGYERTFWEGMASVELRAPLEARLRSDFVSAIVVDPPGPEGTADLVVPLGSGGETQLEAGNLSIILKAKLVEQDRFLLSGGLGATLPTASDVDVGLALVGFPEIAFANAPNILAQSAGFSQYEFENETVYLSPFLAWVYAGPSRKWFHQGFLQIEAAANPASFTAAGGYDNIFTDLARNPVGVASYNIAPGFEGKLQPQTLMRLNLGVGRELFAQPRADWLQRLAGLAELHYTTTLEDATLVDVPLVETLNVGQTLPLDLDIGNLANRVDVLNAALGLSAEVRSWVVTNGFVAPIRDSPDRGFDFEYNIQLQRLF